MFIGWNTPVWETRRRGIRMLNQAFRLFAISSLINLVLSSPGVAASPDLALIEGTIVAAGNSVPPPQLPPPGPTPVSVATPVKHTPKAKHHVRSRSGTPASAPRETSGGSQTFLLEEAKNLIVSQQPYRLRFEDEESFGKLSQPDVGTVSTEFSPEDVEQFRTSVQTVGDYRIKVRNQCLGASTRYFLQSLDKYLSSIASFNRRALPLVADISENNSSLVLVVNRAPLVDAPVLVSRYLQFKKQRFKESMNRFLPSDNQLVASMVQIARILKVNLTEDDWNRSYGLRDNALELVSLWPRELIFDATEKLSEAHETACIIDLRKELNRKADAAVASPSPSKAAETTSQGKTVSE